MTILAILLVGLFISPLLILVSSSLKTYGELRVWPPSFLGKNPSLANFKDVLFGDKSILVPLINSLRVSLSTMVICTLVATLAAYAITRYRFLGRQTFLVLVILSQMFADTLLVNPMYLIFRNLGILDTRLALIIATTATSLPMTIWLLYSFFSNISLAYEEAAWMDGANRIQGIFQVLAPLALPGIVTAGLYAFINSWGNLIFAKAFILSDGLRTIPLALYDFRDVYIISYEKQMAASVLTTVPTFFIFLFIQKHLAKGMVAEGVKE